MKLYREITPLQSKDFFGIYNYPKATFDYPLHSHPEYEINLVMNGAGNPLLLRVYLIRLSSDSQENN